MNQLIKNYIYAVIRRVDNNSKEEIAKELEANIYDMLDEVDFNNEIEIEKVLKSIGSPMVVANKYQKTEKHIVNPIFYYDYLTTIKLMSIFSFILYLMVNIIKVFTNDLNLYTISTDILEVILESIEGAFSIVFSTFAFVTLAFWALSANINHPKISNWINNFNPKEMIKAPDDLFQTSESKLSIYLEAFLGIFFSVLFTSLFFIFFEKIGIYEDGIFIASALNNDYRALLSVLIVTSILFYVFQQLYFVLRQRKDRIYHAVDLMHSVFSIISAVILIFINNLVNNEFIAYLANLFDKNLEQMQQIFKLGLTGIFVVIIIVSIIEIIITIPKIIKSN